MFEVGDIVCLKKAKPYLRRITAYRYCDGKLLLDVVPTSDSVDALSPPMLNMHCGMYSLVSKKEEYKYEYLWVLNWKKHYIVTQNHYTEEEVIKIYGEKETISTWRVLQPIIETCKAVKI